MDNKEDNHKDMHANTQAAPETKAKKRLHVNSRVIWSLAAIILAVVTVRLVINFSGGLSAEDFIASIKGSDKRWLAGSLLGMCGFVFFEGEAVLCICRSLGYRRSHRRGVIYAAADTYFSAITPSASGGQPASAFFMIRDGIPAATVTAVLVFNVIMYTLAAVTNGLVCIVIRPSFFGSFQPFSKFLIGIGLVVLLGMALMFFLVLKRRSLIMAITRGVMSVLHKIHLIRKPEIHIAKMEIMVSQYGEAVDMMTGQRHTVCLTYLFNLLQRFCQIMVTVCMYMALGGTWSNASNVYITQSMVVLGSNSVPIPGSMGVTDYLMLDGFMNLMTKEEAIHLELLSRSVSFYLCVLLSGILVLAAYLISKIRKSAAVGQ